MSKLTIEELRAIKREAEIELTGKASALIHRFYDETQIEISDIDCNFTEMQSLGSSKNSYHFSGVKISLNTGL